MIQAAAHNSNKDLVRVRRQVRKAYETAERSGREWNSLHEFYFDLPLENDGPAPEDVEFLSHLPHDA